MRHRGRSWKRKAARTSRLLCGDGIRGLRSFHRQRRVQTRAAGNAESVISPCPGVICDFFPTLLIELDENLLACGGFIHLYNNSVGGARRAAALRFAGFNTISSASIG